MQLTFNKYHGTGNDFIILDTRDRKIKLNENQIAWLCHRHFGAGADGLIMIEGPGNGKLVMCYFNSDGREASMCGNGGRCVAAWAVRNKIADNEFSFVAVDGPHHARVQQTGNGIYYVHLGLTDVKNFKKLDDDYFFDTGSPHLVCFVDDIVDCDVITRGRALRHHKRFRPGGVNVNFASLKNGHIQVRTYERGVEDETLSCGTGVTAVALAAKLHTGTEKSEWKIIARGGELKVTAGFNGNIFHDIILEGPAQFVYKGEIDLNDDWKKSKPEGS